MPWARIRGYGVMRQKGDADGILEDSVMNRSYTNTQKRTALRVYKRTQSVTKTVWAVSIFVDGETL